MGKKDKEINRLKRELQEVNIRLAGYAVKECGIAAKESLRRVGDYQKEISAQEIRKILDVYFVDSVKLHEYSRKIHPIYGNNVYLLRYSTATHSQEREFTRDECNKLMAYYDNRKK